MIDFSINIDVPAWMPDVAMRHYNRIVKQSLREVLETHHKKRIPGHFAKSARQKYGYAPRNAKYMRYKNRRYHSSRDLVKTGRSEREMTNPANAKITIGGAAEGGKHPLNAKLSLRFPWKGGTGKLRKDRPHHRAINAQQLVKEMQAMIDQERAEMAKQFSELFWRKIQPYRGKRTRIGRARQTMLRFSQRAG